MLRRGERAPDGLGRFGPRRLASGGALRGQNVAYGGAGQKAQMDVRAHVGEDARRG